MTMSVEQPILLDLPEELSTERLLLRVVRPGDGSHLHTAVCASQEHLKKWMPWAVEPMDEAGYEAYAREQYAKFLRREEFQFLLYLHGSDAVIGSVGFHHVRWQVPKLEVGYWLHKEFGGQGYMTEAVKRVSTWAFEALSMVRLAIECDVHNEKSAAVARRCGYTQEARLRHNRRDVLTNDLSDTLVFSRLAPS